MHELIMHEGIIMHEYHTALVNALYLNWTILADNWELHRITNLTNESDPQRGLSV
jgi:hypothetical protein